ncbi:DUF3994 domain-containing protein [Bacillus cytotoxicus]|uniref:DUF3994 domain-containing protein n=1 Tax=Bacillus cereus group sp. BfR-BA-01492 TaxID=2920361 RepID=UPI001F596A77|nr:DUF3994 domain-containing protein [Bacillus cereus group sp. BfR-BA-01492]EMA6343493.1 DUF3994 domain-containing protein [Bacillus cytotoxicus]
MKAKNLVCFALPLMLLGGCGTDSSEKDSKKAATTVQDEDKPSTSKKEDKSSTEKKEDEQTAVKGDQLTVKEYPSKIMALAAELIKTGVDIQTMATSNKTEAEKIKEFEGLVERVKVTTKSIKEVNPPNEFKEDHQTVIKAMDTYSKAYTLQLESVKEMDEEKMKTSLNMIAEGGKYWKEATANIAKKKGELAKRGDGTVSNKETKDLDKKEGIDYDAVQSNVVDGTELIGNWGVQTTEGFKLIFILKGGSSKTFEVYNAGDYPNKTNHIEGTWDYDKNSLTLNLHITKQMSNGVEAEVVHKDIAYKVQNFDRKNLQLFNDKSSNTTRYVKQS